MIGTELQVINKLGLHARAAAKVVSVASRYNARIHIGKAGERLVDAKSIMGLLMLGAAQGSVMQIRIEGDDAEQAFTELEQLFQNRFGEDE